MTLLHIPYFRYIPYTAPQADIDYFGFALFALVVLTIFAFLYAFAIPNTAKKIGKPNTHAAELKEFRRTLKAIHRQDKLNAALANNQKLIGQAAEAVKLAAETNGVPVSAILPIVEYLASVAASTSKKK